MPYISQGTVSVDFDLHNNAAPTKLFFVASCDYSIKHGGKNYAVFVDDRDQNNNIIREDDGGGVIVRAVIPTELTLTNLPQAVARSSWIAIMFGVSKRNIKVEMRVHRPIRQSDLFLAGIRVLTK